MPVWPSDHSGVRSKAGRARVPILRCCFWTSSRVNRTDGRAGARIKSATEVAQSQILGKPVYARMMGSLNSLALVAWAIGSRRSSRRFKS